MKKRKRVCGACGKEAAKDIPSLYILVFKDEPLIKVGRSVWIPHRVEHLSRGYNDGLVPSRDTFDSDACYKVDANCECFVVFLESALKKLFKEHRTVSSKTFKRSS